MKVLRRAGLLGVGVTLVIARSAAAQDLPPADEKITVVDIAQTTPIVTPERDVVRDAGRLDHYMASVKRAFELQLNGGGGVPLGAGIGQFAVEHPRLTELANPGATFGLTLGYRPSGHWMVGLYGTASQFARGGLTQDASIRSATGGIQADYHFRPSFAIDPWISLASGWRGLWISGDRIETTSVHGFELARFNVGLDFRVTRDFAFAPVVGSDVTLFVTRDGPGFTRFTNISNPTVNYFFFGGLQARFNIGGARPLPYYAASKDSDDATL